MQAFCGAKPVLASNLLKKAYQLNPNEPGLLVNLGLTMMQRGLDKSAAYCYMLALQSNNPVVLGSANKNLGLLRLWQGNWKDGWYHYLKRYEAKPFAANEWRGESLNGQILTVWNDLGMGDAFNFVRYTKQLIDHGIKFRLAVHASQIDIFKHYLAWPIIDVCDRDNLDLTAGPQIPLIHLLPLLDPSLNWGLNYSEPSFSFNKPNNPKALGLCWASNPADPTMAPYKSSSPEHLIQITELINKGETTTTLLSLQTNEAEAHRRLGLDAPPHNWVNTLELINSCRQVFSVDTAVVHLAAGCGIPVQMLLAPQADWRWRHGGKHPWYPSLTLLPAALAAPKA